MSKLGVIWRSAGMLLATDAEWVAEVLPPVSSQPVPGLPGWARGLFAYRGTLVPLVDSAQLLSGVPEAERMANRVIVLRVGTEAAAWTVGLWVDRVLEVERLDFAAAGGHPGFAMVSGRSLGPVAQTRWGQVQRMNPGELFAPEQATVLAGRLAGVVA